ncbi:MAG: EF-P lysine aminoacylase GenX [Gammaproteobacteria bacterium]|nr:EF-P lysine aminoacylase GenX [Gammaproteobacteria bacterium]MCF6229523.1 EF-P lysine aminoacylase GenX [Gammaproteobacteria bacterium]
MVSGDVGWSPSATLENLKKRASILSEIRMFFTSRAVLEVETPILSRAALSDPSIESFSTRYVGPGVSQGRDFYLQTSPEFAMKRLLASGCGAIYQICKVFRQGESGQRHNPEFTMLEWYRPGWSHHQLMLEVEALVCELLAPYRDLAATERVTYQSAFLSHVGVDPFFATLDELKACAEGLGISISWKSGDTTRDEWLDLILSHAIEPHLGLGRLTFLCDYPPSQAALAVVRPGKPDVAERFELYLEGVELANGFHELVDAEEQRQRFEGDIVRRRESGLVQNPLDEAFLSALSSGMPPCAGVALGLDRLLMLACDVDSIEKVMAFDLSRS